MASAIVHAHIGLVQSTPSMNPQNDHKTAAL